MTDFAERAWDALDAYFFPPSPERTLRTARNKLANRARAAQLKAEDAERAEAAAMTRLRNAAHRADEATLRGMAIDVRRKMGLSKRMRAVCRMIGSAECRVASAETATAARDIMRATVGALGASASEGAAHMAAEASSLQRQLFQVREGGQTLPRPLPRAPRVKMNLIW